VDPVPADHRSIDEIGTAKLKMLNLPKWKPSMKITNILLEDR
jgi:hypothetical protein